MNYAMPYFIQVTREYIQKVDELKDMVETKLEETVQENKSLSSFPEAPLMITAGPNMAMPPTVAAAGLPFSTGVPGVGVPGAPGSAAPPFGYQGYGM